MSQNVMALLWVLVSINFQLGYAVALVYCGLLVSLGLSWKALFLVPAITLALIFMWSLLASKEKPGDVIANVKFGANFNLNADFSVYCSGLSFGAATTRKTQTKSVYLLY